MRAAKAIRLRSWRIRSHAQGALALARTKTHPGSYAKRALVAAWRVSVARIVEEMASLISNCPLWLKFPEVLRQVCFSE